MPPGRRLTYNLSYSIYTQPINGKVDAMESLENYILGETREGIDLESGAENYEVSVAMAQQARISLEIASRSLDAPVYDQPAFVEAIKALALGHHRARVRILVQEIQPILTRGHRLLELATRLSSFIELRIPSKQFGNFNQAWLIADDTGYIFRELADRYQGLASFNDPGQARYLARQFDKMWEVAEQDPNLRSMKL